MEKAADELPIEQVAKRWIVSSDPDEAVEKVGEYVELRAQPPGVPRARARPAAVPGTFEKDLARGCASWREVKADGVPDGHASAFRRSTSPPPRVTPASRRSRWASCTG